jgi:hypothetical protein
MRPLAPCASITADGRARRNGSAPVTDVLMSGSRMLDLQAPSMLRRRVLPTVFADGTRRRWGPDRTTGPRGGCTRRAGQVRLRVVTSARRSPPAARSGTTRVDAGPAVHRGQNPNPPSPRVAEALHSPSSRPPSRAERESEQHARPRQGLRRTASAGPSGTPSRRSRSPRPRSRGPQPCRSCACTGYSPRSSCTSGSSSGRPTTSCVFRGSWACASIGSPAPLLKIHRSPTSAAMECHPSVCHAIGSPARAGKRETMAACRRASSSRLLPVTSCSSCPQNSTRPFSHEHLMVGRDAVWE